MGRIFVLVFLLTGVAQMLHAQGNPFELRYLLTLEERQELVFNQRNPFELIRGEEADAILGFFPETVKPHAALQPYDDLRYVDAPGLLFWIYLALFVLATLLFNLGRTQTGRWWRATVNDQLTLGLQRESTKGYGAAWSLWYVFFFANAGIFLYQAVNGWTNGQFPGDNPIMLPVFTGAVAAYFLAKHLVLHLTGRIFPLNRPMAHYSFSIRLFNVVMGMGLFPLNIGMSYSGDTLRDVFFYLAVGWICLHLLFRVLRALQIGLPYLASGPVHFFLYLCTVELAPVLVLLKWLQTDGHALL
ncbi:MAG: DUF4271 domain-containing protein [Saprospiraceae bacterium]|nr:DUF4271 domain-containing protein [Saprospiraceae bacterium]